MALETVNLLIGAGIALLSSILTSILTFIFQKYNEERKRKWQFEDIRLEKQIENKIERLKQLEKWGNDRINYFGEVHYRILSVVANFSDSSELREWIKQMSEKPRTDSLTGISYLFDDEKLASISEGIDSFWNDLIELSNIKLSGNEQLDKMGMMYLIGSKFQEKVKLHGEFLGRIDELKSEIYSNTK